jgi:hypothetical protein
MRLRACLVLMGVAAGCGSNITVEFRDGDGGDEGGSGNQGGAGNQGGSGNQGGAGNQAGTPVDCLEPSDCAHLEGPCTTPACIMGSCVAVQTAEGAPCDDGLFCTAASTCQMGSCVSGPPLVCPPGDGPCESGACNELADHCEIVPAAEGTACDDGNACTMTDACTMGICVGSGGAVTYFADDFSDNLAGWTLGTEWQIGPATTSSGQVFGNPDPDTDTTPTSDDGVAGVMIGGNPDVSVTHPMRYLESPAFDATIDPGPVVLSFQRWLNSDYARWMNNRIEVWNGVAWIYVWESAGSAQTDAAWTHVDYDVTAHKNAAMRVRFGFSIGNTSGVWVTSSWNIDDLSVATASCQ